MASWDEISTGIAAQFSSVGLRAAEISAQALITHEFIKRLHARYQKEGIDNASPMETIVYTRSQER